MTALLHQGPVILAAFLASLVEFVEALTIVLAVGVTRGWSGALAGTGAGLGVLAVLVALFGPALTRIPEWAVQLGVGSLLLLFGLRWLRKAVLRAAGKIALHDEAAIYARTTATLAGGSAPAWDRVAVGASFKIVMLEGIEVVFIVIALGSTGGQLLPAIIGAAAALLVVIALGAVVHRPLSRVPENSMKFVVGGLLSGFGTFWVGEGVGVAWPGADWSILVLIAGFLGLAVALVAAKRVQMAELRA